MTFSCSQGFQLDGAQQITCGPGGQWQPQPPQCLPSPDKTQFSKKESESVFLLDTQLWVFFFGSTTNCLNLSLLKRGGFPFSKICSAGGCGVPVTNGNSNANLADKYITKTSFASGDQVHYVCDVGYVQAGGSRYRSCIRGKWSPLLLKCERKNFL